MTAQTIPPTMPYSMIVGQAPDDPIKLALELAYVAPRLGGVLISGQRGTGKSTVVRAFAQMVYDRPLVTLPINATEDRVVGGWRIDKLMRGRPVPQKGLLEEADGGVLYVDEVNLLDDHIVNLILDTTATGELSIQREGRRDTRRVRLTLVGTMNPEEGTLRPQLLDRFGLMVDVHESIDPEQREATRRRHAAIIGAVLAYDAARDDPESDGARLVAQALAADATRAATLRAARANLYSVAVPDPIVATCVRIATTFPMQGYRGDLVMLTAARALAAIEGATAVAPAHLGQVARLALQHRRLEASQGAQSFWAPADDATVAGLVDG